MNFPFKSLALLADDCLVIILDQLSFRSVLLVAVFSGDRTMQYKSRHLVRSLNVPTEAEMVILMYFPKLLAFFPCLTRLAYGDVQNNTAKHLLPRFPLWLHHLPASLLELKISCMKALNLFILSASDDKSGTFKMITVRDRFPQLQTLHVFCGRSTPYSGVKDDALAAFFAGLPPSLTSLILPICHYTREPLLIMLPPPDVMQNLVEFNVDHRVLPGIVQGVVIADLFKPIKSKDKKAATLANNEWPKGAAPQKTPFAKEIEVARYFRQLRSLSLSRFVADASFDILEYMTTLETLNIGAAPGQRPRPGPLKVPSTLTSLTVYLPADAFPPLLRNLPKLLTLDAVVTDSVSSQQETEPLPAKLRRLHLSSRPNAHRFWFSALPPDLTSLRLPLPQYRRFQHLLMENISVTHLELSAGVIQPSLRVSSGRSVAHVLPPALTSLKLFNFFIHPDTFFLFPDTLRTFGCSVRLTLRNLEPLEKLSTWSEKAITECIRQEYLPDLTNFTIFQVSVNKKLIAALQKAPIKGYALTSDIPSLSRQCGRGFFPPSLTIYDAHERNESKIFNLRVTDLPQGLTVLRMTICGWQLPKESKKACRNYAARIPSLDCDAALLDPAFRLPQGLRHLEMDMPRVVKHHVPNTAPISSSPLKFIYPLLHTAPLQALVLTRLHYDHIAALNTLPPTLTHLKLDLNGTPAKMPIMRPHSFTNPSGLWLPNLQHFCGDHLMLDYVDWKPRLGAMKSFNVSLVVISAAQLVGIDPAYHDTDSRNFVLRRHLLPLHLHHAEVIFVLDKDIGK